MHGSFQEPVLLRCKRQPGNSTHAWMQRLKDTGAWFVGASKKASLETAHDTHKHVLPAEAWREDQAGIMSPKWPAKSCNENYTDTSYNMPQTIMHGMHEMQPLPTRSHRSPVQHLHECATHACVQHVMHECDVSHAVCGMRCIS